MPEYSFTQIQINGQMTDDQLSAIVWYFKPKPGVYADEITINNLKENIEKYGKLTLTNSFAENDTFDVLETWLEKNNISFTKEKIPLTNILGAIKEVFSNDLMNFVELSPENEKSVDGVLPWLQSLLNPNAKIGSNLVFLDQPPICIVNQENDDDQQELTSPGM